MAALYRRPDRQLENEKTSWNAPPVGVTGSRFLEDPGYRLPQRGLFMMIFGPSGDSARLPIGCRSRMSAPSPGAATLN
jgi:hypothetical protein